MLKAKLRAVMPNPIRQRCHYIANGYTVIRYKWGWAFGEIQVPEAPQFDEGGSAYFYHRLASCGRYLEYGSGGSTIAVAQRGVPFISVENDRRFHRAVRRKIEEATGLTQGCFISVNVGAVREWGFPVITDPTARRLARWRAYPLAPWPSAGRPDVVLVDGRFRVACALASIKNLYDKVDFEILFDDYADREYYSPVERFANLREMHGRMAVFKQKVTDLGQLDAAIEHFVSDFR
jgi:hypothetical protein